MELEARRRLARAIAELRVLPAPDETARERLRHALHAARGPRTIVLSMRRATMAAGALVALTSLLWWVGPRLFPRETRAATPVQFLITAPDARSVALAGDFNGWDVEATPLRLREGGVWSVIVPLAEGAFAYSFLVDGREWRADPAAPGATSDFGRPSSLVLVTAGGLP